MPYDGELGQHAVKKNFTPKDLEAPELYPGASISRDNVYGTLACIATIQRPGLEGDGARIAILSAHVGNPGMLKLSFPMPSAPTILTLISRP